MTIFDELMHRNGNDGPDAGLHELLASLDPDLLDSGYWNRFHRWVVNSAAPELARRRQVVRVTVGEVMASWWRTLVPTAVMAAALAGMVLLRASRPASLPVLGVEELLTAGLERPVPAVFDDAGASHDVSLAQIF